MTAPALSPVAVLIAYPPDASDAHAPRIGLFADRPLVVLLTDSLLFSNRQALKQRVLDELVEGRREFVLDFAGCGYIDGSGLGVLVSIAKKIRDKAGQLVLVGLNEDLRTLLEITKIDTLFTIADSAELALATFIPASEAT
jgi:anti-sigma B factor antagonist